MPAWGGVRRRFFVSTMLKYGVVELRLNRWGDVIRVRGSSVKLELIGEAEYVEEFGV